MTVRRYPSGIVGLPYPNRDGEVCHLVAGLLKPGDVIELRPEPENRHDPRAIAADAVLDRGQVGREDRLHCGYMPARHVAWLHEAIDRGQELTVTVGEIHRDRRGIVVNVDLDVDITR